ncbi:MAG: serine/threonine protein kinase [Ktedonobacterales bacterium]|nr:serine/threonine protein kinase [Ktedonobacterales bacterium]
MALEDRGSLVGQRLGEYQLMSLLGVGGMAEVYLARDLTLGREVAVKVLPAALAADPEYVVRFKNEARQVGALNHPHIVPVYTSNLEHGLLYLVMPVLRGSLRERLEREGTLPPADAVELAAQVASGLYAAHQLGLVHRDVKPENILLNTQGQALLSDFGIARQVSFTRPDGALQTLAATGLPVGTPEYMAPEQLRGGNVDQRADIYALGAVLYELLTGVVPHDAPSPYEVAALVLTAPITPPSARNPAIWPALEHVVLRAMAFGPDERYPNARSFALALRQALAESEGVTGRLRAVAGARATRRFTHPSLLPRDPHTPRDTPGDTDAVTVPLLAAQGRPLSTGAPTTTRQAAIWETRYRSRTEHGRIWLVLGLAVVLLVGGLGSASLLRVVGGVSAGGTGDALPPIRHQPSPTASRTSGAGGGGLGFPTMTVGTVTIGVISVATPTPDPSPTPTATPPTPSPSPSPSVPLTFSPSPLNLYPYGTGCTATLIITNGATTTVGWEWQPPQIPGYTFHLVNLNNLKQTWPSDMSPGISPSHSDTLRIQASSTPCQALPTSVTVRDSLGNTYTLTMRRP